MRISDAATILELSGAIDPEQVKRAYRRAARRYHPDRNPAGAEMMKMVNAAYEALKDFAGEVSGFQSRRESGEEDSYPEAVSEALNAILDLEGLRIEICGAWVWVSGDTFPHRSALKRAGFRFACKKKRWYFRPEDWVSSSRGAFTMEEIRARYGSAQPERTARERIEEEASA